MNFLADTSVSLDFLEEQRHHTDPLADQIVERVLEEGGLEQLNDFFKLMTRNDEIPQGELPDYIQDYFIETAKLPDWAEPDKILEGEKFFELHGPIISMLLLCKSLPATYACAKGAEVLHMTGRFEAPQGNLKPFTRRLMETSQFVVDVMSAGGLAEGGKGIRTAQKVRLIHASIRYYLKAKGNWDVAKFDEPINQEDMCGTLLSFSVFPLEGLEELGLNVTEQEREAYLHAWKVVGHIMGVRPELLPKNYEDGKVLGHTILDHQKMPSKAGRVLTHACVEFLQHVVPGNLFDFYPEALINFLIGDELSEIVGIEVRHKRLGDRLNQLLCRVYDTTDHFVEESEATQMLARKFNQHFLQSMLNLFNDHKQVHFYIPPGLRENWAQTAQQWDDVWISPSIGKWRLSLQRKES